MQFSFTSEIHRRGNPYRFDGTAGISGLEKAMLLGGMLLCSVLAAAILIATNGRLLGTVGLAGAFVVCFITFYNFNWGFYTFVGLVLALDQFQVPEIDSVTYNLNYFNNINTIPYLPNISWAGVNPMELHLALLVMLWIVLVLFKRYQRPQRVPVWVVLVAFLAWLCVGLVQGLQEGGDLIISLWELRGLCYFALVYALVPQIIQSKKDLQTLMWVCIGGVTFKALQGAGRFVLAGVSMAGHDTFLNHEDPLFITTVLAFLGALIIFRSESRQKTVLFFLSFPLLIGFYSGNRRAAYASLAASLAAFVFALPRRQALRFWITSIPVTLLCVVYALVFWESDSKLATPLKQIKSGFAEDKELTERNYYSNLYRKIEDYDLAVTVQNAPLTGIGFGRKYEQPVPLQKIGYSLRDYMAHNNVIWLFVKTGAIGFFLFWFFFDSYAARISGIMRYLNDPYLKAVCVLIIVAIINQIVAAYFDLHMTAYRPMIYLGILMGLLPAIARMAGSDGEREASDAR